MKFPEPELSDTPEQPIEFFFEDVEFDLPDEQLLRDWLLSVAAGEDKTVFAINYVFCSDEHLRGINVEFLDHDYYTDIITFDNSDGGPDLSGEMYISTERVADNARTLGVPFRSELCRVMVHGLLHLAGFGDKTVEQEALMRQKEDHYLQKLPFPG